MATRTSSDATNQPEVATLLSIEEVATRLGVGVRHIRRLVHERRIPFIKWGHLLRFDPVEITRWIDESRVPPAA
jgi:excisionase family DNA binding protein